MALLYRHLAGLCDERQLAELLYHILHCAVRVGDVRLAVHLLDGAVLVEAVAEARRVGEQVADGDGPLLVHKAHACFAHAVIDFHAGEFRDELADGIIKGEVSLFVEHHDGGAGDGLCHRVDSEERVALHGRAAFEVEHSVRLEVKGLAAPREHGKAAGELAVVYVALHHLIDAAEALG